MKRAASVFISLLLCMSVLAACGKGSQTSDTQTSQTQQPAAQTSGSDNTSPSPASEPVTISWLVFENAGFTATMYQNIIDQFEAQHEGIKIDRRVVPGTDISQYLRTLAATDQLPDMMLNPDVLAKLGLLRPLDKEVYELLQDAAIAYYGDDVYLLPTTRQVKMGMFYNKKIFQEVGVQPPSTWEEFVELNDQLQKAGVAPIVQGGPTDRIWTTAAVVTPMMTAGLHQHSANWATEMQAGTLNWSTPALTEILRDWKALEEQGYFHKGSNTFTYDQYTQEFLKGNAAMAPNGPWFAVQIDNDYSELDIGWFAIPQKGETRYYEVDYGNSLGVNKDTKHPEAVNAFLKFFFQNEDTYRDWIQADGALSTTKNQIDYEMSKTVKEIFTKTASLEPLVEWNKVKGDIALPAGFGDYVLKSLQEIFIASTDQIPSYQSKWDEEYQNLLAAEQSSN